MIYIAPYGPGLVPIESMYSRWKSYLLRHHVEIGRDWRLLHYMTLASITPAMALQYFKMTTLVELVESNPLFGEEENDEVVLLSCTTAALQLLLYFLKK